jgi:hypothetical protein
MPDRVPIDAGDVLDRLAVRLAPLEEAIRSHRFVAAVAAARVPEERLRAIAGEQRRIIASDRRSFAQLAARFPAPPAGDFFLSMAQGEGDALALLDGYSAWQGIDERWLDDYEPDPRAQAYPAFVSWLALNGTISAVGLAFVANLAAWGDNCGALAAGLRNGYGAGDDAVAFFEFFAHPPPELRERALAVVQAGLDGGDDPADAARAARLLQAYELMFWDALGEDA